MERLPIYNALINEEIDGICAISLVDFPAVESDFVAFDKKKRPIMFSVQNEEERMVLGVVMRADFPIYRRDDDGYEYYIQYSKETIKKMSQKLMRDGLYNEINTQHTDNFVEGVELLQMFIKDVNKGINPQGFDEIEDGSLFAQYHITNDEVWAKIKNGEFAGFSLEGYFTVERADEDKNNLQKQNRFMSKISKLKEMLRSLLVEASNVMTDKGNIYFDGDEIAVGMNVFSDEDMETAIEDGTYETETQTIVIEGGIVKVITDKETTEEEEETTEETTEEEEETTEETTEEEEETTEEETTEEEETETTEEEDNTTEEEDDSISVLEARIADLEARIAAMEEALNKPVTTPIEEDFKKQKPEEKKTINWSEVYKTLKDK